MAEKERKRRKGRPKKSGSVSLPKRQSTSAVSSEKQKKNEPVLRRSEDGKRRHASKEKQSSVGSRNRNVSGKSKRDNGSWRKSRDRTKSARPKNCLLRSQGGSALEVTLD